MRFLSIWTPDSTSANAPMNPAQIEAMGKLVEESMKAGELIATGGLAPASMGGALVRNSRGKVTVTDGPFAESKELVAGFAILEAKSREHAIEMAKRFVMIAGDGESDLRQIME